MRDDAASPTPDEGTRRATCPIGASAATQLVIQVRDVGIELCQLVMTGQWDGCVESHASSRGALVDMVRFKRSLGCVGASSRARYSV